MNPNTKKTIFLLTLGIFIFVLSSCTKKQTEETEPQLKGVEVSAASPIKGRMTEYSDLNANTFFLYQEIIRGTFSGFVSKTYKNLGDNVIKGDLLFSIRTKESSAMDSASMGNQFNGLVNIYAHSDGILTELSYHSGDYITETDKLALIVDPSSLRIVKEYDYILTGKNTEILNFDMDFKTSFITYAQSNGITKQQGSGAATPAKDQTSASSTQNTQSFLVGKDGPVNSAHLQLPAPNSAKNLGTAGDQSPERNMAADIAATIYAPAEMLTVSLTINGDPDYIKQDGLFLIPTSGSALTPYDKNRGILFNSGEIYINLTFKVPRDLNQSSGLLEPIDISDTTTYKRNIFSGYFRVLKVTTKINKGLFTQELEVVRVDDSHDFQIISAKPLTAAQQENLNYTNAAPPPASAPSLTKIEKQRTMGAALAAGLSSIGLS